jgi:hypothetical protein
MAEPQKRARREKELEAVSSKLDTAKLSQAKRMELLRRQAQLGDERDQAVRVARRAESDR